MDVFSLAAKITLDTNEYESALGDASGKTHSFGEKLKTGLATAAKAGAVAITAVTGATVAMSKAFMDNVGDLSAYGDNIDKMSQKMGMSAQAYQEWDAVMQHSGTSIESLQAGMKTLANAVESGNGAFERLGITQEQIASMNNEELFSATITALQNVENETERTYLAGQLLGRGATELGALLNTSAEDTQAMKDRVHELGGVMSDEAVKAAAAYQDSLQDMQTSFSGLSRGMIGEFLPSVTTVMNGLTEIFSGNGDAGIAMVTQGVSDFMDQLQETIPRVLEIGSQIVGSLTGVIMENVPQILITGTEIVTQLLMGIVEYIPQLATAAVDIVNQLSTSIVENLPLILNAALETVMALASGISESLPELIPTIVDVVLQIVETLIDNVDQLIDASIEIIMALADGLIEALPTLIEKIPVIIEKLVTAIVDNLPEILQAGVELILTLAAGVIQAIPELVGKIPELIGAFIAGVISFGGNMINLGKELVGKIGEGIKNLASSALQWGKDLIDNFVQGIKNGIGKVKDAVSNVANTVKNFLGFSEPEKGPLSNFHTYAPDMMQLFAHGITENSGLIEDSFNKALDFKRNMNLGTAQIGFESSGMFKSGQMVSNSIISDPSRSDREIVINLTADLDGDILARKMFRYNQKESGRRGPELVTG